MNGWICLHRCITRHWIWEDANKLKWWIDLLLRANHEDKKVFVGSLVECKRGEVVTSLCALAKEWKASRDVVRHFLDTLERDGMIARVSTHKHTQITICNYESYQDIPTTEPQQNPQLNPHKTAQAKNCKTKSCKDTPTTNTTTESTTKSTQTTIYMDNTTNRSIYPKEINNYIGDKKQSRFSPPTLEEVQAYCKERGNNVDAERFIDYYTSKGWMIGKNKMKDWKASVRTWERNSTKTTAQANLGADERVENGRRTYGSGSVTVPMEAPPRPSAKHAWKAATGQWVVY